MNNARITYPDIFKDKTKNEIKIMIEDNIFNIIKKEIAIQYYVYEECMVDIGMQYNLTRKSVSRVLKNVIIELKKIG